MQIGRAAHVGLRDAKEVLSVVRMIGLEQVHSAVSVVVALESMRNVSQVRGFRWQDFWKHSIACGIIARAIADQVRLKDRSVTPAAFTTGILHDVGKLFLLAHFAPQFSDVLAYMAEHSCSMLEAEQETLGTNHAFIGQYLAERWALPAEICVAIGKHHKPLSSCASDADRLANIVHVADAVAQMLNLGSGGNRVASQIRPGAIEALKIEDGLAGLQADSIRRQVQEFLSVLPLQSS